MPYLLHYVAVCTTPAMATIASSIAFNNLLNYLNHYEIWEIDCCYAICTKTSLIILNAIFTSTSMHFNRFVYNFFHRKQYNCSIGDIIPLATATALPVCIAVISGEFHHLSFYYVIIP